MDDNETMFDGWVDGSSKSHGGRGHFSDDQLQTFFSILNIFQKFKLCVVHGYLNVIVV